MKYKFILFLPGYLKAQVIYANYHSCCFSEAETPNPQPSAALKNINQHQDLCQSMQSPRDPYFLGSWLVISRVISRITIVITHITGLITPLITTHEPPSRIQIFAKRRC